MFQENESMEEHKPKMAMLKELIGKMYEIIAGEEIEEPKEGKSELPEEPSEEPAEGLEEAAQEEPKEDEESPEAPMNPLMDEIKDFMRGGNKPKAGKSVMIAAKLSAKPKSTKSKMRY